MRHMLYAMGKRDAGSDAPVKVSLSFVTEAGSENTCGGKLSCQPRAAGTDRGNPRDAGEWHACQVFPLLFFQQEGAASRSPFFRFILPDKAETVDKYKSLPARHSDSPA